MNRRNIFVSVAGLAAVALVVVLGSRAIAQDAKDQPQIKLPPGWTEADMQACAAAATPGKEHEFLAKGAGVWQGKAKAWMAPDTEAFVTEMTNTATPFMDGRFLKIETAGDMPGMGPFSGFGLYGFDTVGKKYVCTWIDNCSTQIMQGTGEASADGKVMTWTLAYNCPIAKKPVGLREVDTITGPDTRTMEIFMKDPKSGKEFCSMRIEFTKKNATAAAK